MCFISGTLMAKNLIVTILLLAINFTQLAGLPILHGTQLGRVLAESDNVSDWRTYLDNRTVRVDPSDHFRKYRGGYNITNKHYWSSTAFTGVPGYVIAVIWAVCGIGYGVFLVVRRCCCKNNYNTKLTSRSFCQKLKYYRVPLLLAIVLTPLAVTACGLVLGGNAKFHSRAKMVIELIVDTTNTAANTIYSITGAMKDIGNSLKEGGQSLDVADFLVQKSDSFNTQASHIQIQTSANRHLIDKGQMLVYIVTTTTISLTLILVVVTLAFGILKFRRTLQVLVAICWFFTVLCWLFFGLYFFIHKFTGDTCTALEGFEQDPYNNSLSPILPCNELLSGKQALIDVSGRIYGLVNMVNANISTSYGNIVQLCNPFSPPPDYNFQPGNCPPSSLRMGDVPRVLDELTCPESEAQTCKGGVVVPTSSLKAIEAYAISIQKFLDAYPNMESLVECQIVKDVLIDILHKHCSPFMKYLRMVWSSLVFLSTVLLPLILTWIVALHLEKHHHHNSSRSFDESAKTRYTDALECGMANEESSIRAGN